MNAARKMPAKPLSFRFEDDGSIPNNPKLPLLIYQGALDLAGTAEPERRIEQVFKKNGWGRDMWRNGIYPYPHYHSMIHEALGVSRGRARVRFGGGNGKELDIGAGDVAVLPAGTGHQCLWASPDLCVIGAYPPTGSYNLCRGSKAEHAKAVVSIPQVPPPQSDPVHGEGGPLIQFWK